MRVSFARKWRAAASQSDLLPSHPRHDRRRQGVLRQNSAFRLDPKDGKALGEGTKNASKASPSFDGEQDLRGPRRKRVGALRRLAAPRRSTSCCQVAEDRGLRCSRSASSAASRPVTPKRSRPVAWRRWGQARPRCGRALHGRAVYNDDTKSPADIEREGKAARAARVAIGAALVGDTKPPGNVAEPEAAATPPTKRRRRSS
jgi:hypothetical protein